jgi:hypothetical protein
MNKLLLPALAGFVVAGFTLSAHAGPDGLGGPGCSWSVSKQQVVQTPIPTASKLIKLTKIPNRAGESPLEAYLKTVPTGKKTGS